MVLKFERAHNGQTDTLSSFKILLILNKFLNIFIRSERQLFTLENNLHGSSHFCR